MKNIFRLVLLVLVFLPCTNSFAQENNSPFSLLAGAHYNNSPSIYSGNTGIGLFIEPNFTINDKWRLGYRLEPTALAHGEGVIWRPSCPECRSGSNYVINNYFKADYLIGQPKYGQRGGLFHGYVGLNLLVQTHKRWNVIEVDAFTLANESEWTFGLGLGARGGVIIGRFDLSASFNVVGNDFDDYFGFGLGYFLLQ